MRIRAGCRTGRWPAGLGRAGTMQWPKRSGPRSRPNTSTGTPTPHAHRRTSVWTNGPTCPATPNASTPPPTTSTPQNTNRPTPPAHDKPHNDPPTNTTGPQWRKMTFWRGCAGAPAKAYQRGQTPLIQGSVLASLGKATDWCRIGDSDKKQARADLIARDRSEEAVVGRLRLPAAAFSASGTNARIHARSLRRCKRERRDRTRPPRRHPARRIRPVRRQPPWAGGATTKGSPLRGITRDRPCRRLPHALRHTALES